jgi:2-methylcitrate dehydratase PrpD
MTISTRLADLVLRPVSAADRERAALHVLDWIGCATIGATTEPGQALRAWARDEDAGRIKVLLGGSRSLGTAVIVNGSVGNVLEMDDIHASAILHPGPVVVPAALALAERDGAGASALLDAVVRGYEAMIRVGQALGPGHYRYWHNTATCGPFGAAAAAGSILGLTREQFVSAFGNAGTQASGLWQVRLEPVMSKQLHNGRAAHAGVLAADLAKRGFTGPAQILEGPLGFFKAMCPDGDVARVIAAPDAPWKLYETGFKPWPACRHAHATIDAALALRDGLDARDIESVEVRSYRDAVTICDRLHPETTVQAKFSLQHSAAVIFLEGLPRLEHFEAPVYASAPMRAFRERVRLVEAEPYASAFPNHYGAEVAVTLKNGETRRASVADALGDPKRPLTIDAIRAKALTLMQAAGLDAAQAERIAAAALALPSGDVEALRALLAALP